MQPTDESKFTEKVWDAIVKSQDVARRFRHQNLEVEHLTIALLESEHWTNRLLNKASVSPAQFKQQIESFAQRQPRVTYDNKLYLGQGLDILLDKAEVARKTLQDDYISIEHILLALSEDNRIGRSAFRKCEVDPRQLETAIKSARGTQKVKDRNPETEYEALEKYGRDLTGLAEAGMLNPLIGQDMEIRRVMQVFSRFTKNNPLLIGESGVCKTAIVEALAHRIINRDVPETLRNRRLIRLDIELLVAGAISRSEVENRLQTVLREVASARGQVILFIEELHTIVREGSAQSTVDAGNLLKPALVRGELHCIAATTPDGYRKHIEKDSALERYFQKVFVEQPKVKDTISILRGLKERYEVHHGIKIADSALVAAATLSDRYISDRFLPDKAIDLVDEAAAKLKMEITSKPVELETIERRLIQLEMERLSLEGEGQSSVLIGMYRTWHHRIAKIDQEIDTLKQQQNSLNSQWQSEKDLLIAINTLKEEEEHLRHQIDKAERDYDLNTAAQLKYGRLQTVHDELESKEAALINLPASSRFRLLREELTEIDIIEFVSEQTGISIDVVQSKDPSVFEVKGEQIFISYSRKDREWLEKLQTMLKPAIRQGKVSVWDDTHLKAGDEWEKEITGALKAAKVAILMVSDNFLASDFIYEKELTPLLKRAAEEKEIKIIWIYLNACLHQMTEIPKYQAAHDISQPLGALSEAEQNRILCDICYRIISAAN